MTDIINKEIRGVTMKVLWAFLIGYTSILLSVVGIYFTSKNNFELLTEQINSDKITKEFIGTLTERSINQITIQQASQQNQISLQRIEIERIKVKLNIK